MDLIIEELLRSPAFGLRVRGALCVVFVPEDLAGPLGGAFGILSDFFSSSWVCCSDMPIISEGITTNSLTH